jgi:hypothetical protein
VIATAVLCVASIVTPLLFQQWTVLLALYDVVIGCACILITTLISKYSGMEHTIITPVRALSVVDKTLIWQTTEITILPLSLLRDISIDEST